ncbi:MAG: hypothetical protein EPN93_03555 [Spirochaetes bacterium]|nr:MAG: hypothetical protein EPN93_03555 [Spirochaetota bacterium]
MSENTVSSEPVKEPLNPDRNAVAREARALLEQENINAAVRDFKADSEEKKLALEFINGHMQFMRETVENDRKNGLLRKDLEIRDLVSHINMMLKHRDEGLFFTLVKMSPVHYKAVNKDLVQVANKKEE